MWVVMGSAFLSMGYLIRLGITLPRIPSGERVVKIDVGKGKELFGTREESANAQMALTVLGYGTVLGIGGLVFMVCYDRRVTMMGR